jgi:hypothetical protein
MNRNENEAESFAGNFMAFGEEALFFEVPYILQASSGIVSRFIWYGVITHRTDAL